MGGHKSSPNTVSGDQVTALQSQIKNDKALDEYTRNDLLKYFSLFNGVSPNGYTPDQGMPAGFTGSEADNNNIQAHGAANLDLYNQLSTYYQSALSGGTLFAERRKNQELLAQLQDQPGRKQIFNGTLIDTTPPKNDTLIGGGS